MAPVAPLPYLPYAEARGRPHVVVDGAAQEGTLVTLSHWPGSGSPPELRADTSAEIALRALGRPGLLDGAEAVTNNHPDEDGLLGVWVLVDPEAALARAERVVAIASAGDFGVVRDDDVLRSTAAVSSLMSGAMGRGEDPYVAVLPRVAEVLDDPGRFEEHWRDALAAYRFGREAIDSGAVTIEEVAALDLAVVAVPAELAAPGAEALHSSTACVRLLVLRGDRVEYRDRYETWVQYASRPVPRRVDLAPLATELTAAEPAGARWAYDGVQAIQPRLRVVAGRSTLAPGEIRTRLEAVLADAPPAWDPYA